MKTRKCTKNQQRKKKNKISNLKRKYTKAGSFEQLAIEKRWRKSEHQVLGL